MTDVLHTPASPRRTHWTRLAALPLSAAALAAMTACGVTTPTTPGSNTPATTTTKPAPTTLPSDLAGENGQVAYEELKSAGFKDIVLHSNNGKAVLLYSDWTVISASLQHGTAVVQVKK
jgi:hypothetical protein